jgi:hypothetical protein
VRVRVPLAGATADGICGLPLRVQVPAGADPEEVQRVLVLQPSADLLVEVGNDVGRADAARRLVDRLTSATPQRPPADAGSR